MDANCLVPHFFEKKATKVAHAQCTVTKRKKKTSHSLSITAKVNGFFFDYVWTCTFRGHFLIKNTYFFYSSFSPRSLSVVYIYTFFVVLGCVSDNRGIKIEKPLLRICLSSYLDTYTAANSPLRPR